MDSSSVPKVLRFGRKPVPKVLRFGRKPVPKVLRFGRKLRACSQGHLIIPANLCFGTYDEDGKWIPTSLELAARERQRATQAEQQRLSEQQRAE